MKTASSKSSNASIGLCLLLMSVGIVGCGRTADSVGEEAASSETSAQVGSAAQQKLTQQPLLPKSGATSPPEMDENFGNELFGEQDPKSSADTPKSKSTSVLEDATPEASLMLRADLSPARLTEFLQLSDLEMQSIASGKAGILDQRKANQEMIRVGKLKLEAAKRLKASESADVKQKVMGIRGELQSLSHLAALGDLKSANDLETLAMSLVDHADASIAADSRLVLIGLSLERIQNGTAKDATEVMEHVNKLAGDGKTPDIAAMMIMGQARAVLEKYGFGAESTLVRNQIVDLFASHSDPNVASLAIEIAGTPRFADVDRLLRNFSRNEPIELETWRTTIDDLLVESPDLSAVQFLAGAALQLEAAGREDLADVTYKSLQSAKSLGDKEKTEIELAIAARTARKSIIGQSVDFELPSTDGRPLSISSYKGQVVLMPFWAINFAESLSVLQLLGELRDQSNGKVEIIGVNLDSDDELLDEFMAKSPVPFRSFYSQTKHETEATNKIAEKFGVVSTPFIAVIDRDGRVAAIDFTGQRVKEIVGRLIATP